jgi:MFS transporter, NNP family, nitrate/nitrite transporter
MQDDFSAECPMPEPFRARIGLTFFLGWLFYLGFVTRVMFAPLLPEISADLDLTHAQAGSLFLMMSLGYLLAPLCSGLISSRIMHRGNLNVSAWMVPLALIPFLLVDSLWAVRLFLMLIGLSAGLHLPSAIATITAEVRKQDWGKALSVHQLAPPLSFVTAPLIAALLMKWLSWRWVLGVWACVALISAVGYALKGKGGDFKGRVPHPDNVRQVVSQPSFWIMVLLLAMAMGGNAGIYAMLPLFLITDHGMDLTKANVLIGLSQASGLLMVMVAGYVTDRIGQKATMAIVLLGAGVATVLIGLLEGGWLVLVLFIQPMLLNSFFPAAFAALTRVAPPSLRSVTSALGPPLSFLIGGGLLPLFIGYLGEVRSFSTGIVFTGAFILAGPLLVRMLRLGQYDDQDGC